MGIGDEIMAAGRAQALSKHYGTPVAICDKNWNPRYHEVWENNPYIVFHESDIKIQDYPGCRAYIDHWINDDVPTIVYNDEYRNTDHPGTIFVDEDLVAAASCLADQKSIVINPTVISPPSSSGKIWPKERWNELSRELSALGYIVITIGATDPRLDNANWLETESIMEAAAVIAASSLVITSEGGIHHVAGAVGTNAIVLFGGFVSPKTTGYNNHINLYVEDEHSPCGIFYGCEDCKKAMESITVNRIVSIVESDFKELKVAGNRKVS